MYYYRQSVILFGMVLPVIIAAAVIAGGVLLKSKMTASFDNKQKTYRLNAAAKRSGQDIETQIRNQRQHLDRWNEQLSQETASATAFHLRKIAEHLPPKELQQTAFERPNGTAGGLGTAASQKSSQLRIAFRGTFRTLQRAFLELETRMPQLQLQEIRVDPAPQSSLLNVQVTYTAWEN